MCAISSFLACTFIPFHSIRSQIYFFYPCLEAGLVICFDWLNFKEEILWEFQASHSRGLQLLIISLSLSTCKKSFIHVLGESPHRVTRRERLQTWDWSLLGLLISVCSATERSRVNDHSCHNKEQKNCLAKPSSNSYPTELRLFVRQK